LVPGRKKKGLGKKSTQKESENLNGAQGNNHISSQRHAEKKQKGTGVGVYDARPITKNDSLKAYQPVPVFGKKENLRKKWGGKGDGVCSKQTQKVKVVVGKKKCPPQREKTCNSQGKCKGGNGGKGGNSNNGVL